MTHAIFWCLIGSLFFAQVWTAVRHGRKEMRAERVRVFLFILRDGDEWTGRQIRDEFKRLKGKELPLTHVHLLLGDLENIGLVEGGSGESSLDHGGLRPKCWSITEAGEKFTELEW